MCETKAIELRLAGVPVKEVMEKLHIRNYAQLQVRMKWYREGELHRLEQPVLYQSYGYGKSCKARRGNKNISTYVCRN
ncbi:hypothetical protein ACEU2D_22555 [Brevibacillus laterosporus]|uniref:hypothetical protein n=1 Tax=Brevibacillus laterosporus TaxID=1465 RepID=UPI0035A70135